MMIEDIDRMLKHLGIKRHRIVKHLVKRDTYDITYCNQCKEHHITTFYTLFLFFREHTLRFDFTKMTVSELEKNLKVLIDNQLWYCNQLPSITAKTDECLNIMKENIKESGYISFEDLVTFCTCNSFVKRILYNDIIHQEEVSEGGSHCLFHRCYNNAKMLLEIAPEMPYQELSIRNIASLEKMQSELALNYDAAKKSPNINMHVASTQTSGEFIVLPEIMKILCSFLCQSLYGDQILTGCSFVSKGDFNKTILRKHLSLYREVDPKFPIDAEGIPLARKYYIKNGVLVSAFNDIKSASFLQQEPGDTSLSLDSMRIIIDHANTYIGSDNIVENRNFPIYDKISGQHIAFDSSSGLISMTLFSTNNGTNIHIHENLISFLNKVIGALAPEDNCYNYDEKQCKTIFCL